MVVPGHPHTGLQTVSWLFSGEIEHRDTTGAHALVRPGEVNLMTAGRGIAHSEYSTPDTTTLHGAQLWVALPEAHRLAEPGFEHYAPPVADVDGARVLVFLGSLFGQVSPVSMHSELVGAEVTLPAGASLDVAVDAGPRARAPLRHRHRDVGDATAKPGEIVYVPTGVSSIRSRPATEPARLLLLGGAPLGEQIVMWWNFIGRSHDEIVDFRERWQQARATGGGGDEGGPRRLRRLPRRVVDDASGPRAAQPPPALPRLTTRSRRTHPGRGDRGGHVQPGITSTQDPAPRFEVIAEATSAAASPRTGVIRGASRAT